MALTKIATKLTALAAGLLLAPPAVTAGPAVLIDAESGAVLHHEDAFELWSPASLTKLMTAYVTFRAVENGELTPTAPVVMTENAASNPPSKMGYPPGTAMTVDNALKMLIIQSANDIAVAIGEAVAGTEQAFVERMNAEAQRLGMTDTRFMNPHGLHHTQQYSTARDMAVLARAIRTEFRQYDALFEAEAIQTGEDVTTSYNILLGRYDGADGMKTGFVCASGFNIIASATRQDRTLIAVVMGEESQKARAEKSAMLLDEGFADARSAADPPSLQTLPSEPDADGRPANIRELVCTDEARQDRWDGRQIEGFLTFDVPTIEPLTRDPVAVQASLGGVSGQSKSALVLGRTVARNLPIPAQRPEPVADDDIDS